MRQGVESRRTAERVATGAVRLGIDGAFRGLARVARATPVSRPDLWGVTVVRDVPYGDDGAHRLDVYRPRVEGGPLPCLLYVHGGAFRMLSKDSHFHMGIAFARMGFVVFNVDYRLAPAHRYPAPLEDCAAAYLWLIDHAARFGGDPGRAVVAGESAGANLAAALAVAACWDRPEPWARALHDAPLPRGVAPACGVFQVSDLERLARRRTVPWWIRSYLRSIPESYLGSPEAGPHEAHALADPVLVLEGPEPPRRRPPPFFLGVGTRDPVLDDTRRLAAALERHDVPVDVRYYPGGGHAFHAFLFQPLARRFWRDQRRFLEEHALGTEPVSGS